MSNGRDRRRQLNQQERLFVYERAGGQCQNCGRDLPPDYHNAHLAAWSRGGATTVDNIRAWCPDCNLGLGAQDSELAEGVTLRQWQEQAFPVILRQLYQSGVATLHAAPGAGKTLFAGAVFQRLLELQYVNRLVVVVPNLAIVEQWRETLGRLRIHVDTQPRDGVFEHPETVGAVITYHGLPRSAGAHATRNEQAGAYLRETRRALATYLDRLRQYPTLTLTRGRPRDHDPTDTVATTWQVSLERVRSTPGAVELLEVCAFLGPEEIPRELFGQRLDSSATALDVLVDDPFALDDAVAGLRRFGLAKADEQTLTVHRLLQQVVRDQLDPVAKTARVGVAVRLLNEALPSRGYDDPGLWPVCARLLPHVLAAIEHATQLEVEVLAIAALLTSAGNYLHRRARYAEARALHERALAIREAHLDPEHPDTASSLNNLGRVLADQGNLDAARPLFERTIAIREARLGPDHPDTATSLNNLAGVLWSQGDLDAARPLLERALTISEVRLGADHPDIARNLDNLGTLLAAKGDKGGARRLHERALAIYEARLGADHFETALSLNNLAHSLDGPGGPGCRRSFTRACSCHL